MPAPARRLRPANIPFFTMRRHIASSSVGRGAGTGGPSAWAGSRILDRLLPRRHRALFLVCAILWACGAASKILAVDPAHLASARVFASYWGSGWAASQGLDPYAVTPFTQTLEGNGLRFPEVNLNPPILLPLFQFLARFDLFDGARLLAVGSTLGFLLAVALLLRGAPAVQRRQIIWVFVAPAFLDIIALGQIYVALMILAALAGRSLARGRTAAAGVAIGALVALKPIFLLWPVMLWLAGHRRAGGVAGLVAAGLTAASLALYGPVIAGQWLAALGADHHALMPTNISLGGYLTRLGLPRAGLAAGAAVAVAACLWAWRRRPGALDVSALALAAAMLASPLSWLHYTLILVPALLRRPWGTPASAGALLLCTPIAVTISTLNGSGWGLATLGGLYLAGLALIAMEFLRGEGVMPAAAEPHPPALRPWQSTTGLASG